MKVSGRKVEWRRLVAHTGLLTLASAILSLPATAAAATGVAVGTTANKVATVVERSRSRGNRDYRVGSDWRDACVRR